MTHTPEEIAELDLLLLFDLSSAQTGIKIHKTANPASIAAAQSLFKKGLITQVDGGYLTSIGITAAEHVQALFTILNTPIGE